MPLFAGKEYFFITLVSLRKTGCVAWSLTFHKFIIMVLAPATLKARCKP